MKINLITAGTKMPSWINEGFLEYQKRFPKHLSLVLTEIDIRSHTNISQQEKIFLRNIKPNSYVVVLDEHGKQYTSTELSAQFSLWLQKNAPLYFLIGGPDGHGEQIKKIANEHWSLSHLTLPHSLCRVVLAEQLYRAISILENHPYHRT